MKNKYFTYKYSKVFKIQIVLKKTVKILNTKYYYIKTCDAKRLFFQNYYASQIISILTNEYAVFTVSNYI